MTKPSFALFLARAWEKHGDRYDYRLAKADFVSYASYVLIICNLHGTFRQLARRHASKGHGCPKCGRSRPSLTYTTEIFCSKATDVHADRYDYSQVVYNGIHNKVHIICRVHGAFWQTPTSHIQGKGCPTCAGNQTRVQDEFVRLAQEVHAGINTYDYSQVSYVQHHIAVIIVCSLHGPFHQLPSNHLSGKGCPHCAKVKNYSTIAIQWLEYRAKEDGVHIKHALNGGEQQFRHSSGKMIRVDGFSEENKHVYEFLGDLWHGNPAIYSDPDCLNPVNKRRMGDLYEDTLRRNEMIVDMGYTLTTIWEVEWRKLLKNAFFD